MNARRIPADINESHQAHLECPLDLSQNQIRLLKILPSWWDDHIRCSFEVVSLTDNPTYTALSYVWGEANAECEVFLHDKTIMVKPNLSAALRRLRALSKGMTCSLWIDALCIDQKSTLERNQQVGMMGQIYSRCTDVLVWLGELQRPFFTWKPSEIEHDHSRCYDFTSTGTVHLTGNKNGVPKFEYWRGDAAQSEYLYIDHAARFLKSEILLHMACFLCRLAYSNITLDDIQTWELDWSGPHEDAFGQIIYDLVNNAWFKRLWVVQEIVLPPKVQVLLGPVKLPLETITQAHARFESFLMEHSNLGKGPARELLERGIEKFCQMISLRNRIRRSENALTVLDIRLNLSRRSASEDLDQIYSLLGLVSQDQSRIKPNYSVSPQDMYTAVSREYITSTSCLLPLVLFSIKRNYVSMPSWAIDWTEWTTQSGTFDYQAWSKMHTIYNASKGLETTSKRSRCLTRSLFVDGVLIDTVKTVGELFWSNETIRHAWERELAIKRPEVFPHQDQHGVDIRERYSADDYPQAGESLDTVWVRTLCADSFWSTFAYNDVPTRMSLEQVESILRYPDHSMLSRFDPWKAYPKSDATDEPPDPLVQRSFDYVLSEITNAHKIFVTEHGYLGLAHSCEPGDVVYILKGSRMPIVLRKLSTSTICTDQVMSCAIHDENEHTVTVLSENDDVYGNVYKVSGYCYMHSFMDGEVKSDLSKVQRLRIM